MDNKEYLTNKAFCPVPWTGLMYNFNGDVKTCIRSSAIIGNICENSIQDILNNSLNVDTKTKMLNNQPGERCSPCYDLEVNKNSFDIISDRVFYLKELKSVDKKLYSSVDRFELNTIDVRWSNVCNFACVYCCGEFSSRWASEMGETFKVPTYEQIDNLKNYVLDHADTLKHVYMAGGEPLLMKENLELLQILKEKNPNINLRINTNLSKVDTRVFEMICEFPNVHWIISLETIEEQFEYIRYGGSWKDFTDNLNTIRNLNHKVSFNMLYFLLNFQSLFSCIDFLQKQGFHNNSFIIGPLLTPLYLNVRHIPEPQINKLKVKLQGIINAKPGYLLEDSLKNILTYLDKPFDKNLINSYAELSLLDNRRGLDSKLIFPEVYNFA